MLFWMVAAVILAGLAAFLLRAALQARPLVAGPPDLELYKAQLAEVDRDAQRGVIGMAEADGLRAEISRRILDAHRMLASRSAGDAQPGSLRLPLILGAGLIAAAGGLYLYLGAPGYPDIPHGERIQRAAKMRAERPSQAEAEAEAAKTRPALPAPSADYAALMDKLRAAVAARPSDVQGLTLLATNERNLGNVTAAARAQEKLVAALGAQAKADDYAALADVYVDAAGGTVTPEAEKAIRQALALDPANGTARFYAGLTEAQTGRPDLAFSLWQPLLKDSPPDAPWVPFLNDQMPMLAEAAGRDFTPADVKGPSAADMSAAQGMSAGDRAEMIKGMVAGLEERLFTQGGSAQEWAQLMTALGVLGDKDRAKAALARAEQALKDDPAGLEAVQSAAQAAGTPE